MEETGMPSNKKRVKTKKVPKKPTMSITTKIACIRSIFEAIRLIVQKNEKRQPVTVYTSEDAYSEKFAYEEMQRCTNDEIRAHGLSQEISFPTGETVAPELAITEIIKNILSFIIAVKEAGFSKQDILRAISTGAEFFTRQEEDGTSNLLSQLKNS